jgi:trans-aconitate 2-methyltransferase
MIAAAQRQFPGLELRVADARTFQLGQKFDAIFSNAALHWIKDADRVVQSIADSLKPGGRLVAEFGGKGNVLEIASFLSRATDASRNPWYFPSIAEYSTLLEAHGLEVVSAQLYHRPTPLNDGEQGLRNWIKMFGNSFLEFLTDQQVQDVLHEAESELRAKLHDGQQWVADYRRIRVVALKYHSDPGQASISPTHSI